MKELRTSFFLGDRVLDLCSTLVILGHNKTGKNNIPAMHFNEVLKVNYTQKY